MLGKNSWKNVRKTFFYIHTNIVTKKWWGTKRAKEFFPKHNNSTKKKFGKKSSEKNAKIVFLYSHKYRYQKMGEENALNNFSRYTRIVLSKNVGKKIVGKKCEKRFFIFTRISWPKNGGKKTRETIFPETHE